MGYYFLVIGSIISLFAVWALVKHLKLIVSGRRTPGEVIEIDIKMRSGGNRGKRPYYHPVIEFKTEDGTEVTFTYGGGSTRECYQVGDEVTVVYNADTPQDATMNTFLGLWAGPLAAAILGAGTLYAGLQLLQDTAR